MQTPPPPPLIKRGWLRALLFTLACLVTMLLLQALWILLVKPHVAVSKNTRILVDVILALLGASLIAYIFRRFIDKKTFVSMGFEWQGRIPDMLAGFLVAGAMLGVGTIVLWLLGYYQLANVSLSMETLPYGFVLFLLGSLFEELFMRGYVLNNLMCSMNKFTALGISALLFSFFHGLNPNITALSFTNLFLAGILLGASYLYTKNLWFPISLHLFWNFIQGPILGYEVSGISTESLLQPDFMKSNILTGGEFGFEGSILCTIILVLASIAIIAYYEKQTGKQLVTSKETIQECEIE